MRNAWLFAIAPVSAAIAAPAAAQQLTDKAWLQTGAYFAKVDSSVQLNATNIVGTEIDFEGDLEMKDRQILPSLSGGVRLGSHGWLINADIYSLRRSGNASINRNIVVEDVTYPAGAAIQSRFSSTTYRIAIGNSFLRGADYELGAALGLHLTNFDVSISGQGFVGASAASTQVRRQEVLAPLPTLGLYGSFSPAPGLRLGGRVDYLKLKISDYKGGLTAAEASIAYRIHKNVGIGAMYRYVDYTLDVTKERWNGSIDYQFSGPIIFLELAI